MAENLYVHFPFCRRRCGYCTLYSREGVSDAEREKYVSRLVEALKAESDCRFKTVYFGGGSPGICDLRPLLKALRPQLAVDAEFTVELHPLDVSDSLIATLRSGGVNRISLGVQSLDDSVLAAMGRGYSADEAERAFGKVVEVFGNVGIDLIVGLPHDDMFLSRLDRLRRWGLRHCSVYALQNERKLPDVPSDDALMDTIDSTVEFMKSIGLERYEISNYAAPGFECEYNFAVWRGEDYLGLGDGACGRLGLMRTRDLGGKCPKTETVSADTDDRERRIFRLRTREGIDTANHDEWVPTLDNFVKDGLLVKSGRVYCLTPRGSEVCDSILVELV